jgi:hypothetical protein
LSSDPTIRKFQIVRKEGQREYIKFNIKRITAKDQTESDFDKTVKRLEAAKQKKHHFKQGKSKNND